MGFYVYDITKTAAIPTTKTPVSVLDGIYPNIQFLSINEQNNHIMASYFNQPTSSGWAVYDLYDSIPILTNIEIAVASGVQFFVVGQNGHVFNCLFTNGVWTYVDMNTAYGVPTTSLPVSILYTNPV